MPEFGTVEACAPSTTDESRRLLARRHRLPARRPALPAPTVGERPTRCSSHMPAFFDASVTMIEQRVRRSRRTAPACRTSWCARRPRARRHRADAAARLRRLRGVPAAGVLRGDRSARGWLEARRRLRRSPTSAAAASTARLAPGRAARKPHAAYEDFAAVATDLVAPQGHHARHLGATGGSNGGLLVGNMLTQYPELFGAVVCSAAAGHEALHQAARRRLLVAEYGDPDLPDDW